MVRASNPEAALVRSMNNDAKPAEPQRDDASLLMQLQAGERRAMGALYDRYCHLVYAVSLRVLREPATAEDVLQEVFMQLWRNPDSFTAAKESLGGWLAVVARNRSIDILRRKRSISLIDNLPLVAPGNLADESERKGITQRARGVIQQLPREQRKSLDMAFFDGLSHSEIAEMTDEPLGTVKTRIHTALLSLREAFRP